MSLETVQNPPLPTRGAILLFNPLCTELVKQVSAPVDLKWPIVQIRSGVLFVPVWKNCACVRTSLYSTETPNLERSPEPLPGRLACDWRQLRSCEGRSYGNVRRILATDLDSALLCSDAPCERASSRAISDER